MYNRAIEILTAQWRDCFEDCLSCQLMPKPDAVGTGAHQPSRNRILEVIGNIGTYDRCNKIDRDSGAQRGCHLYHELRFRMQTKQSADGRVAYGRGQRCFCLQELRDKERIAARAPMKRPGRERAITDHGRYGLLAQWKECDALAASGAPQLAQKWPKRPVRSWSREGIANAGQHGHVVWDR